MIIFHLTPRSTPPLNRTIKWDHVDDKRRKYISEPRDHDIITALIEAKAGDRTEREFQVEISQLKDKDVRKLLGETVGRWHVYDGHMDSDDWYTLLLELKGA